MKTIDSDPLPQGYELPDRIPTEAVRLESDLFGRVVKVYYSPFGPIDITGKYMLRKYPWWDKLGNWIKYGCWI